MSSHDLIDIIDIEQTYDDLNSVINGQQLSPSRLLQLHRLIDKISDSSKFAITVSSIFNTKKLSEASQLLEQCTSITEHEMVDLPNGFSVVRSTSSSNYSILNIENDELFIDNIDYKILRKVLIDFNVAIRIRNSRLKRT